MGDNEHDGTELHASCRDGDWRTYGSNMAEEAGFVGGQFRDARRLLIDCWQGWTSGEPSDEEVLHELLATIWAMLHCEGCTGMLKPVVDALAAEYVREEH